MTTAVATRLTSGGGVRTLVPPRLSSRSCIHGAALQPTRILAQAADSIDDRADPPASSRRPGAHRPSHRIPKAVVRLRHATTRPPCAHLAITGSNPGH